MADMGFRSSKQSPAAPEFSGRGKRRRNAKGKAVLAVLTATLGLMLLVGVQQAAANHIVGTIVFVGDSTPGDDGVFPYSCGAEPILNPCDTIQHGIDHATSGADTVQVAAGTYPENLNLAKDLTLRGAQAGMDACGRTASESIVTGAGILLELDTGSANATIDGFTFSGGTRGILSDTGPIDELQILNNRIRGFTGNGVFLDDNGINITADQNEVDGTAKTGGGALFHLDTDNFDGFQFTNNCVANGATATGFFVDGNRNVDNSTADSRVPAFSGNLIDRNQTGMNLGSRAFGSGPIMANTFSNSGFDGLQGGPRDSIIWRNTFDRNGRHGLALTSFGNTTDPTRGAQNVDVLDNCFARNATTGIFFSVQVPGTQMTNMANRNNITGNAMGARYAGPDTIDVTQNWWGAADGPGPPDGPGSGDGIDASGTGTFLFAPFLVVSNPLTPACPAGAASTLTLSPKTATNDVDTQHCVTATVRDTTGAPTAGVTVRFSVTGSVNTSGSATTNASGQATFCYTGPALPGADAIEAYGDNDNDNVQDPGEPFDTATKTWTVPTSTPICEAKITQGGWITADNGDRGSFGGNAKADQNGNPSGEENYQDHGPAQPMHVKSTQITAITCNDERTQASIFGVATIDGTGSHTFRIDVQDLAEPGKGVDTYRIQLDTGYDSGEHTLKGGNVQIH